MIIDDNHLQIDNTWMINGQLVIGNYGMQNNTRL